MDIKKEALLKAFVANLKETYNVEVEEATNLQKFKVFAQLVQEELVARQEITKATYFEKGTKQLYYLSIEFLLGRLLGSNLLNLGNMEEWREILDSIGLDLNVLENEEPDAGTGNGGLGRLVACFMDSIATLQYPGYGYGIRYKYGLFRQKISKGEQVEVLDTWLQNGYPWEVRKEDEAVYVKFGGTLSTYEENGKMKVAHHEDQLVKAVPYDIPVVGYRNFTVNAIRLWSAEMPYAFTPGDGQSYGTTNGALSIEAISEQLYPDDSNYEGKLLRLKQQYFMVSATLQNIIREYKAHYSDITKIGQKVAIHLNDTHPTLAIPELMRILMDEEGMGWEQAWRIVINVMAYTNHTILPEALETWPSSAMQQLLPRIYQIIQEIDRRFCTQLAGYYPNRMDKIERMSIISGDNVRMANLACAGCHSVNGVAALHTKILEAETLHDFFFLSPHKFNNKTNGITHRRWLLLSNPKLTDYITELIGNKHWKREPEMMRILMAYRKDQGALDELRKIKEYNKVRLANFLYEKQGVVIDPTSRFDIQVKRIHLYKRQLLNALHLLQLYRKLKENPNMDLEPVTFIFGGKAAPGYYLAKRVIKFINDLAEIINRDPICKGKLSAVFIENFNVTAGEYVYPAADVSEQISLASKEASGTGNMKFMMNGAVTLGTWDGANVEIAEHVGLNNIVIFGMRPEEVIRREQDGTNRPWETYHNDPEIKELMDSLTDQSILPRSDAYPAIRDELLNHDTFMVLEDFKSYCAAHEKIQGLYRDQRHWNKMCLLNIANSGYFSSDRTIKEYAEDIWVLDPVVVE